MDEFGFSEQYWAIDDSFTYQLDVVNDDGSTSTAIYHDTDGDGEMDARYYFEYDEDGNETSSSVKYY